MGWNRASYSQLTPGRVIEVVYTIVQDPRTFSMWMRACEECIDVTDREENGYEAEINYHNAAIRFKELQAQTVTGPADILGIDSDKE